MDSLFRTPASESLPATPAVQLNTQEPLRARKMNTPQSMMIGWASLIAAAGVSYYYAKKEIDARRKLQRDLGLRSTEKKEWYERLEEKPTPPVAVMMPTTSARQNAAPTKPPEKSE